MFATNGGRPQATSIPAEFLPVSGWNNEHFWPTYPAINRNAQIYVICICSGVWQIRLPQTVEYASILWSPHSSTAEKWKQYSYRPERTEVKVANNTAKLLPENDISIMTLTQDPEKRRRDFCPQERTEVHVAKIAYHKSRENHTARPRFVI